MFSVLNRYDISFFFLGLFSQVVFVVSIGAFYSGCAVQPVALKYPNRLVSEKVVYKTVREGTCEVPPIIFRQVASCY